MQIGKQNILKTSEDHGKTMNEDSRDLERHYKGLNYVTKSQYILYRRKHPKDEGTCIHVQEISTEPSQAWSMRLGHAPCPLALGHAGSGSELFFPHLKGKKPSFSPQT